MVDLPLGFPYGLHVHMETVTGSADGYFHLPDIPTLKAQLKVYSTSYRKR